MVKRICAVLLFLVVVCIHQSIAQSIRGKIIYVHPSQVVKFKFKSAVDNYSFVNKDDQQLFIVKYTNKNLWINSLSQFRRSRNLVITEGGNTHLFILMYKDHLESGSEVYYDFSNRKNADDLVKNNTAGTRYVSNSSDGGKSDAGKISSDGVKTDQKIVEKKTEPSIVVMSPGTTINAASPSQKTTQSSATPTDQKTVPNDAEKKPTGSIIAMSPGIKINTAPESQKNTQSSAMPVDQKTVRNDAEKKPTGSIIAMSPGIKINTAPESQKPTQKSTSAQNATSNTAGVALPPSQKSVSPTEKPKPIVEAIPSWTDSVRYELYIEAGDSLAWIAKDYTNALKWYDSALRIRPNAALPKKQIKAVKHLQLQSDQLAADKAKKDRFDKAMVHYKKADALKAERKYAEAHAEYTKCVEAADTTKLPEYTAAQLYYINDARDYVTRLQHYLPKPVVNTPPPPAPVEPEKKKKRKKSN